MHGQGIVFWVLLIAGCQTSWAFLEDIFKCKDTDLVFYKLVFETNWTEGLFPKQYPKNRPPAQWSKVIGMTHDENYVLYRIGEKADKNFKEFVETGKTEALGTVNKVPHVLDEFSASSIKTGAGKSEVSFLADGNHSLVSLAAKLIPSPDWFVGVDSLALCVEGNWIDSITVEANPIDGGTDEGFTFTAPNWESEPQQKIFKITAKWPNHPVSSFHYPGLKTLPAIATFHIIKKRLYQLRRKLEIRENKVENVTQTHSEGTHHRRNIHTMGKGIRKHGRMKYKERSGRLINRI